MQEFQDPVIPKKLAFLSKAKGLLCKADTGIRIVVTDCCVLTANCYLLPPRPYSAAPSPNSTPVYPNPIPRNSLPVAHSTRLPAPLSPAPHWPVQLHTTR